MVEQEKVVKRSLSAGDDDANVKVLTIGDERVVTAPEEVKSDTGHENSSTMAGGEHNGRRQWGHEQQVLLSVDLRGRYTVKGEGCCGVEHRKEDVARH